MILKYINIYLYKLITKCAGNAIQNAINLRNSFLGSKSIVSMSFTRFGVKYE